MTDIMTRAKALFDLGAHLGHRKSRLHPRARQYVYQIVDGVSIIDLDHTIAQIDAAKKILSQASAEGKSLLVAASKRAVAQRASELAKQAGAHYVTAKWLPGLLTNFNTISKNVQKLTELKRQRDAGEWAKYVKHEQMALQKEVNKLEHLYGGIWAMNKVPDLMLIVDIKREKNAVLEAKRMHIPVIAIVDTNSNPDEVDHPVMLNDDTPAAVEAVLTELLGTFPQATSAQSQVADSVPPDEVSPLDMSVSAEATVKDVDKPKKPTKRKPRTKKSDV